MPGADEYGEVFAAFLAEQLAAEQDRRSQLTSGAEKLLTSSAAFVALIVAVAALVLGNDFQVTGPDTAALFARGFTVGAIVAFSCAAFFAFRVQAVRPVKMPSRDALDEIVEKDVWTYSKPKARNLVARQNVITIKSMRDANDKRVESFKLAGACQLVAAVCVVGAVISGFFAVAPVKAADPQIVCINGPCPSESLAP